MNENMQQWINDRPQVIQKMIAKVHPCKLYRLKPTGQYAKPYSYSENSTIEAIVWTDFTPPMLNVFGLDPNDFEELNDQETGHALKMANDFTTISSSL